MAKAAPFEPDPTVMLAQGSLLSAQNLPVTRTGLFAFTASHAQKIHGRKKCIIYLGSHGKIKICSFLEGKWSQILICTVSLGWEKKLKLFSFKKAKKCHLWFTRGEISWIIKCIKDYLQHAAKQKYVCMFSWLFWSPTCSMLSRT